MEDRENIEIIKAKIEPKIDEIKTELKVIFDSRNIAEIERVSRNLSNLSTDDLFRPFTI
jgi:hypothetical protein